MKSLEMNNNATTVNATTEDRKLILRAVGETENFREEVLESDLMERLEELKEEIDLEVTYEGDNYVEFDQQVLFWLPADTTLINEYLEAAWWCAQYALFDQCQEFIDFAQGYTK